MIRRARNLVTVILLGTLLLVPSNVFSCGPFFEEVVFSYLDHPDYPLKPYADGNLGIVRPTNSRIYLVTAYRYLAGKPLSASERNAALDAWYEQIRGPYFEGRLAESSSKRTVDRWQETRKAVLGDASGLQEQSGSFAAFSQYAGGSSFQSYMNCSEDAFRTAVRTFEDRSNRYTQAELKDWVQAQDTVFSNCSEKHALPAPAPASASVLFRADRAYQVAAARFYSGDLDESRAAFQAIAGDSTSPWHELARYLAVRALIRKGTLVTPTDRTFDSGALAQAESELRAILADSGSKTIHGPARQLLGFVLAKLHPEERAQDLARKLSGPGADADFEQDLIDYVVLLDRLLNKSQFYFRPGEPAAVAEQRNSLLYGEWYKSAQHARNVLAAESDLTDWITTFQAATQDAKAHAISKWREGHALQWLVAAIDKTTAKDVAAEELMTSAAAVVPESPAYDTISFHRVRLMLEQGRTTIARDVLDNILAVRQTSAPPSAVNAFLHQRERVAASFAEFLKYAPRYPANLGWPGLDEESPFCESQPDCRNIVYGERFDRTRQLKRWSARSQQMKEYPLQQRFDADTARTLNERFPLNLLVQATASNALPVHLQNEIALAAWARAVILGDETAAQQLGLKLRDLAPKLAPYLAAYDSASSSQDKKFAGVFAILHFPALRPYVDTSQGRPEPLDALDNLRDNWWCSDVGDSISISNYQKNETGATANSKPDAPSAFPLFLTSEQTRVADTQWKALSQIGPAPNYLSAVILSYAKAHPDDARVPESLHLSVRTTRYGCVDGQTSSFSREAFRLLHQRYPNSSWAKATKYWF